MALGLVMPPPGATFLAPCLAQPLRIAQGWSCVRERERSALKVCAAAGSSFLSETDNQGFRGLEEDDFDSRAESGFSEEEREDFVSECEEDSSPEASTSSDEPVVTGEKRGPYPGPLRVDTRRKRGGWEKPPHRLLILRPPMSDRQLAQRLLASPQLRLKSLPLLSSCLPIAPLQSLDKEWFYENSLEVRDALGYATIEPGCTVEERNEEFWQHENPNPAAHLDTLLYLAFQHEESVRAKAMRHARISHSRLAFLGEFVLELALAELLLQVYPKETPANLRERAFGVTNKRGVENILREASLYDFAFPDDLRTSRIRRDRSLILQKSVFLGIVAAVYLSLGMSEVYRLLFETFGFDLDAKCCQPKQRSHREDVDHVSADFKDRLTWEDIAYYKPPGDAIFAAPRLFRACVPPGMYRFHKNLWELQSLPQAMSVLGYPLSVMDDTPEFAEARTRELGLGLQLCFTHPSMYKCEHPRFCNERLEYLGSKIQDVVIAERLLMKMLDAPQSFLQKEHRRLLMNRICGRRLRMKRLHKLILYAEERQIKFDTVRRLRNYATNAVQQAIHGLAYAVYGKAEVRRLLLDVFEVERPLPTQADFNDVLAGQNRRFTGTLQPVY